MFVYIGVKNQDDSLFSGGWIALTNPDPWSMSWSSPGVWLAVSVVTAGMRREVSEARSGHDTAKTPHQCDESSSNLMSTPFPHRILVETFLCFWVG